MKLKNKLGLTGGLLVLATLVACGKDGIPFSLGTASGDGTIDASEAAGLLQSSSETGEPDDVTNLTLVTSETDEPFDLPD